MKNNNYICHPSYLKNIIAYDHDFWYTSVKRWKVFFFSIFQNFEFLVFSGVKKTKNGPKLEKKYVCCTPCLRNHASCDFHLWYTCVKWYLQAFFHFDFPGCFGGKRAKNIPKCQNILTVALHICMVTSYDHHVWYTSECKMISPGVFFSFFQNFDFLGC